MRVGWLLVAAVAAIAACSRDPLRDVRVGEHQVSVRLPKGWEVQQEPAGVVLAPPAGKGQGSVTAVRLRDMGPMTPDAYRRELATIAELWRSGRVTTALERLRALRWPAEVFASLAPNADFGDAWTSITAARTETRYPDVEADFAAIDKALQATRELAPTAVMNYALEHVDLGGRREIKSRNKRAVGGRDGEEIETRDTLAQGQPRRALLVQNDGRMLLVTTDILVRDADVERYEAIRDSIKLAATR